MTQDEIIEMARQAGITVEAGGRSYEQLLRIINAFAKLVAHRERRNCVDTLCEVGNQSMADDPDWAETVFWCCSRINNPEHKDKTLCPDYKKIDNSIRAKEQA